MRTYEDFTAGLEIPLGPYVADRDDMIAFAREFDPQPFHLDDAAGGANELVGSLTASGWHSCAMLMRMMADGFINDSSSQGSPGVDFVNWKAPVRPGDTITGRVRVLSRRLSGKRPTLGIAKIGATLENQDGVTVLETEYTLLLLTREGVAA
ncbi:MaoC family dehydratase [Jiella endophytica]|uniref:MaoC family dehydratase n=1 Tax=Jiella endophytica TaxID=2558362 RepID=A0A4Y8RJV7_9HYPH|nr:MaoC family dehydratase [Jiella endophytica]TFF22811.1 MaoC family dehydratase [Jiella endophytica]